MKTKLPKKLWVYTEYDRDGCIYYAEDNLPDVDGPIGIYQLIEEGTSQ